MTISPKQWDILHALLTGILIGVGIWHAMIYKRVIPYGLAVESTRTCKTTTICEEPVLCR